MDRLEALPEIVLGRRTQIHRLRTEIFAHYLMLFPSPFFHVLSEYS